MFQNICRDLLTGRNSCVNKMFCFVVEFVRFSFTASFYSCDLFPRASPERSTEVHRFPPNRTDNLAAQPVGGFSGLQT